MLTSDSDAYQATAEHTSSIQIQENTLEKKTESKEQFLLQSIAQGNRHDFWQLWLLYEDYLYHCCQIWMGGNDIDAEEVLSQARLKAWEKLPNYASKITNPKAWLTRMTHNLCMDFHRKRQRCAQSTDRIEEIAVTDPNIVASNSDSPESVMLNHELKIYIRHAINSLPPRLREPWNLLYYYQMSSGEIAQRLMLSKDNVYKRIQQGRIILKKQLNQYLSEQNNNLNQINSLEKAAISPKTQANVVAKTFPDESSELSDIAVPISTETSLEIINYQVTSLCLDTLLLAL